jgi:hypothetical protein
VTAALLGLSVESQAPALEVIAYVHLPAGTFDSTQLVPVMVPLQAERIVVAAPVVAL